jgi:putative SOS response-associated peptidase YedK
VTTDDEVFFLAGVWDFWAPQQLASFAIITTEPNALISKLHNRMPVILPREQQRAWLDPENSDLAGLKGMLQPYPAERMTYQAYDRYVSSSRNKEKRLIFPVGEKVRMG